MKELGVAADAVDEIIAKVGKRLVVGAPLAAGKPNHLLNALYRRAVEDPSIELEILTALTLERPKGKSELESRFLDPFVERVFGNYPDLEYELARTKGELPRNVRVIEFYFPPGKFTRNSVAQRDYISSNYTHVARDVVARGLNVLVAQVAVRVTDQGRELSLSCNPDVAVDAIYELRHGVAAGRPSCLVVQVNRDLPFMFGDAEIDLESVDLLIDNPAEDYRVFGAPKMSVGDVDHMLGLNISALVKDGGELQVGIGAIGDAVVDALRFRHKHNATYRDVLDELGLTRRFGDEIVRMGELGTFEKGLFSASEMMVDGFLQLFNDGIIRRKVYDDVYLQRLLNLGRITEAVSDLTLKELLQVRAVHPRLTEPDVAYLRYFGVFHDDVHYDDGALRAGDLTLSADLGEPANLAAVCEHCLGTELRHGAVMHAGFFLGPHSFYEGLKQLPEERRRLIRMRSVRRINQLYGHEEVDRLHRVHGRFVNTAMMVTAFGAAVSDALEDGTVISGVGGQYNFVAMAHELPGGRSVINLRSTREVGGKLMSNIVLSYGHVTIPRHLRDLVVTEYGIADLRGRTDEEVVKALLNVCDSRFQVALMHQAQAAGKLDPDYEIPEQHRHNLPESYAPILAAYRERGFFQAFPLGCDFDDDELVIGKALKFLAAHTRTGGGTVGTTVKALGHKLNPAHARYMERMGYAEPKTRKDKLYARLLSYALDQTA